MIALLVAASALAQTPSLPPEAGGVPAAEAPLESGPELVEFVEAPYPAAAKEAGLAGTVRLLIEIDAGGEVTYVEVLTPAGHGFDEAAVAAAWQFLFQPARDADGPVAVAIEFDYGFVLDAAAVQGATPQEDPAPSPADLPVNLEGEVVEMGTRRPLPDFPVQLFSPDGALLQQTATDADGRYAFRGVPPGPFTLTARFSGYQDASQRVTLQEGEALAVRLWARNLSYRDDEIVGVYRKQSEDITRRTLSVQEVRRIPGTFGDPVRVIQNLPGAARSPFGTGGLIIRGANPEDSAVYVDGIRIPLIYHLGGYVSVINADLIETVDYLPGGYGVRYGRTMGGVVDVGTKPADAERPRLTWSTDALDSGGSFVGRVGKEKKTGVALAARRSYIDALIPLFLDSDFTVRPRWYDYQLKVDSLDTSRRELSFFLFGFEDLLLASTPPGFAQGTDPAAQGDLSTRYSTHRAYVRYERPLGERFTLRALPSIGLDGAEFGLGDGTRIAQDQVLAEVRAEIQWDPSPAVSATAGLDFIGGYYWFEALLPINPEALFEYDPLAEREPWVADGRGLGWGPDLYADIAIRPLQDREALVITPGARLNFVNIGDFENPDTLVTIVDVDPRIAARWMITEGGSLKGGTGLYHQPPLPFELWRPSGTVELGSERAWSSELGWQQELNQAIRGDISVFYKELDDLIIDNPYADSLDDQYFVNSGIGRIYGMELMIRHDPIDRFFGWISYTLSRSERNDDPNATPEEGDAVFPGDAELGEWYPFELDQTHILVAVAGYDLPRDWGVSGKIQYVTGNPYTPYAGGVYDIDQDFYFPYAEGSYNSERLPSYLAVDLRVDKLFTFRQWQLEIYTDLLNVIRGQNPEFDLNNYDYTERAYIRGLPFIPSPGFEAEFNF